MILFLCAQDLSSVWIGLVADLQFVTLEKRLVPPESYLSELHHFLLKQGVKPFNLEGISVVTGPGSFTSSRISLTIANTLHFVYQIPLWTVENPDHLAPRELLSTKGLGDPVKSGDDAHVSYDRPAHITPPRGDKSLAALSQKC